MSSWAQLKRPLIFKERDLQWMVDHWASRQQLDFAVAGAPEWLRLGAERACRRRRMVLGGETFTPDVEWQLDTEHYVVELKSAAKGEPLALAQVLYYSDLVAEEHPERIAIPVIVGQYNMYMRRALRQLRSAGLESIRYLEHNILESGDGRRWFLWLDDPFAQLEPRSPAGALFDELRVGQGGLHWYRLEGINTWFAVEHPFSVQETVRPIGGLRSRHLCVAPLQPTQGKEGDAQREWLVWYGETAEARTHIEWTRDEYYLWSSDGDDGQAPVLFA